MIPQYLKWIKDNLGNGINPNINHQICPTGRGGITKPPAHLLILFVIKNKKKPTQ